MPVNYEAAAVDNWQSRVNVAQANYDREKLMGADAPTLHGLQQKLEFNRERLQLAQSRLDAGEYGEQMVNGLNGMDGPDGFYGDGGVDAGPVAALAYAPLVTIAIASLIRLIPNIVSILRPLVVGVRYSWGNMPVWLRYVLVWLGVEKGSDVIFDPEETSGALQVTDPGGGFWDDVKDIIPGLLGGFGSGDVKNGGSGMVPRGSRDVAVDFGGPRNLTDYVAARVVSSWDANGVIFYRLDDGRLAVQNKHGVWKIWRPKKPIVLFATGAEDLSTLLRADRVLAKQAAKIAKMLRQRGYKVGRS